MSTTSKESKLGVHLGGALLAAAQCYPYLLDFILEIVQNGLDANAKNIHVKLNLYKRTLEVTDDGEGVSQIKFEKALGQIFQTMKSEGKLGRFGRGLISPLDKCRQFTFASCAKENGTKAYIEWKFVSAEVKNLEMGQGIPMIPLHRFTYAPGRETSKKKSAIGKTPIYVDWRTRVRVIGITTDKQLTRLTPRELSDSILERFGSLMYKRGVKVDIQYTDELNALKSYTVEAGGFEGRPLDEVAYQVEGSRVTTYFQLFIAAKQGKSKLRKGKVMFGEYRDEFRFSTTAFWQQAKAAGLSDEVLDALRSGIFEGEITANYVKLHPDRKHFMDNDDFVAMCMCIDTWWEQIGRAILGEIESNSKEARFQRCGLVAMSVVEGILEMRGLKSLIEGFGIGTTGRGHAELPPDAIQDSPSMASPGIKQTGKDAGNKPKERVRPEEMLGHTPTTVQGPRGQKRKMVKGSSSGLQFAYDYMPRSSEAYTFDRQTGILTFNCSHKLWFQCEENDAWLIRYQETVATLALTEFTLPADYEIVMRTFIGDFLAMQVAQIIQGEKLRRRARARQRGAEPTTS